MSNPNPKRENLAPQFQPGQSGNPKGRPKNRVKDDLVTIFGNKAKARKFYALRTEEIDDWEAAVLSFSIDELKFIAKWDKAPAYPKGLAIAILSDMKNGKTTTLDKLRERQHGTLTKKLEITGKDGTPLVPMNEMSYEEIELEIERINKARNIDI